VVRRSYQTNWPARTSADGVGLMGGTRTVEDPHAERASAAARSPIERLAKGPGSRGMVKEIAS
jgi:hypothetical protein